MKKLVTTPKADGFFMPGEYEEHKGTYMIWPERGDNWREKAKYAQEVFALVAAEISKHEKMTMVTNEDQYQKAREMLPDSVRVVEIANNDSWIRDSGPVFVKNKEGILRTVKWEFNAWGGFVDGLYSDWRKDAQVAEKVSDLENVDYYKADGFVLEGGSIHVDGEGTAVVTEPCLLSKGRNPSLTKIQIENVLKEYLNLEKILWLPHGIYGDETNEHVDNVCTFVKPGVMLLAWTDDEMDPQYNMSLRDYEYLKNETDAKGRKLEIHKLLLPKPVYITKEESEGIELVEGTYPRQCGDRLAASYVNFYVCNGAVIMPGFHDENDLKAKEKIEELYPDREVIQIYAREILLGGGNIYCITQQVPKKGERQ